MLKLDLNKKIKLNNNKIRVRESYPILNGRTLQITDYQIYPARKSISLQFKPTAMLPTEAQNIIKRRLTRLKSLTKIKR